MQRVCDINFQRLIEQTNLMQANSFPHGGEDGLF